MRFQQTDYYCGVAAFQNALICLGKYASQRSVAAVAGTNSEGTTEDGILRAALHFGAAPDVFSNGESVQALEWAGFSLEKSRPLLIPIQKWQHWVTVIGSLGSQFLVFDPARYAYNVVRSGVNIWSADKLLKTWAAPKRTRKKQPTFYGIALGIPNGP